MVAVGIVLHAFVSQLFADLRRTFGSMMAVRDIQRRNLGKSLDHRLGFGRGDPPNRLLRIVYTGKIEKRFAFYCFVNKPMYQLRPAKRKKDQPRLSAKLKHML